jgi:hypothetical protein
VIVEAVRRQKKVKGKGQKVEEEKRQKVKGRGQKADC